MKICNSRASRLRAGTRGITYLSIVTLGVLLYPGAAFAQDVEELRKELQQMKSQMQQLQEKIDALTKEKAAAPAAAKTQALSAADQDKITDKVTEQVLDKIQPNLQAASKTFPSEFNPAIGLIIDTVASAKEHDNNDFEFRSAELGISANIDPFTKGSAIITGSPDEFEVEEASIQTTNLPYNLSVKGGRFFADFGRLSKFHDHDLPFVNRPIVLDTYVGGESQGDGLEVNYLFPTEHYISLTAGAYNKLGGENDRLDNGEGRAMDKFTYLGRLSTFFNFDEANNLEVGGSLAYTPQVEIEDDNERILSGIDLTYRYVPLQTASYRGLVIGTELLQNHEDRPVGGFSDEEEEVSEPLEFKTQDAFGMYAYIEARLSRTWYPGFLFDYAEDVDKATGATRGYSPYLTYWVSEYQRLRFQYTYLDDASEHDNQFFLQWTALLGSHVHGFRDR